MTQAYDGSKPGAERPAATLADEFELYDLRVEVIETPNKPFISHVQAGDWFEVIGGRVVFPPDRPSFSLYGLIAVLPFIPAKQRPTHPNDWMSTDSEIASLDPACGAKFRITRLRKRTLHHADYSALPLRPDTAGGSS
ncbi:MAG TPA: TIGR04076 family protein [Burkholderiaceae bacterium]|jgi:uncharacterized repeat protein (TIGR04076 family)|nr:TIGR04076 family protein [Burkholderiaceae bacterium]